MKIVRGQTYQVCQGSGIDSGRIGLVVDHRNYGQDWIQNNEPGRYDLFDPRIESLLLEVKTGKYFTMYKNRLIQIIERKD
jgi:hypothetical protein